MKYTPFDTDFLFDYNKNSKRLGTHSLTSHYHNLWEIYYITDGKCKYCVEENTYNLKAGDIIIIPGGSVHSTEYVNSIHSRMLINCSDEYIPACLVPTLTEKVTMYRNDATSDDVGYIFRKISETYLRKSDYFKETLRTYTHLLFFTISDNPNKYNQIKNEHIQKALEYIKGNFDKNISLGDVAEVCNITSEHLSRIFSKEVGSSFSKFLTLLRLKKAEKLLRTRDDLTIAAISAKCGFNDSNYFSSQFKKIYKVSPNRFRN